MSSQTEEGRGLTYAVRDCEKCHQIRADLEAALSDAHAAHKTARAAQADTDAAREMTQDLSTQLRASRDEVAMFMTECKRMAQEAYDSVASIAVERKASVAEKELLIAEVTQHCCTSTDARDDGYFFPELIV